MVGGGGDRGAPKQARFQGRVVEGAERVSSGAYLGDRDMFLFLVDGNRDLDDPTDASHAGLFRGFMLGNSDVGAAALTRTHRTASGG